eukprot:PhF_6_TR19687/c0_g1_i1/m.28741
MGLDGGTITTRKDIVKTTEEKLVSSVTEKVDKSRDIWTLCAASEKPLWSPIVACGLGKLYRKEDIIEELLRRKHHQRKTSIENGEEQPDESYVIPGNVQHIHTLKDVRDIILTPNGPKAEALLQQNEMCVSRDERLCLWKCPVLGSVCNGLTPFVYFIPCNHVMSFESVRQGGGGPCNHYVCKCPLCGVEGEWFAIGVLKEEESASQLQRFNSSAFRAVKKKR